MAGAISTGALVASSTVERRSSARPDTIFAIIFAVAGAMMKASAFSAKEM